MYRYSQTQPYKFSFSSIKKNIVEADISESELEVRRNNQYAACSLIRQEVSRVALDTGIV